MTSSNEDENELIEKFVRNYSREYEFYEKCADISGRTIRSQISESGIRAIVNYRAKDPDRLKEKLYSRLPEKRYQTEDDIRQDIVDFAGVRVALYFPSDQERVSQIIDRTHLVQERISFPKPNPPKGLKKFDGYHATHFRARISEDLRFETRFCEQLIEIQVASLLMHAWAEVEHDLTYKPQTGGLENEELMILDEINGLVLTGEIALTRLSQAISNRVANKQDKAFHNKYDLASYIYKQLDRAGQSSQSLPQMERLWEVYVQSDDGQRKDFRIKVQEAADFNGSVSEKLERLRAALLGKESETADDANEMPSSIHRLGANFSRRVRSRRLASGILHERTRTNYDERHRVVTWLVNNIFRAGNGEQLDINSDRLKSSAIEIYENSLKRFNPMKQTDLRNLYAAIEALRDHEFLDAMSENSFMAMRVGLERTYLKLGNLDLPFPNNN